MPTIYQIFPELSTGQGAMTWLPDDYFTVIVQRGLEIEAVCTTTHLERALHAVGVLALVAPELTVTLACDGGRLVRVEGGRWRVWRPAEERAA